MIKTVRECIKEEKSFSIETTLAGKNAINQMKQAKENGYEIIMFFLGLKEVNKKY
ncbi:hypothetical protein [Paenisporosarcina sp. TG20]|uniref:hypothetical protein n=1 Tax=Paenisporosarcina sp. TG20 TaxID=1211706 RepID=UPI00031BA79A|nr:hypothetical protein [Paenisporosarcina sp. TG20]